MSTVLTPRTTQEHRIPPDMHAAANMPMPNYSDCFTVDVAQQRSAEDWARVMLEHTQSARRWGPFVWGVLCGLRLVRHPSPDHIGGWKVAARGDDWIRLESASWFMTAHAVCRVLDEEFSVALFVRYDNPIARVWWPLLSQIHRRAMPVLLQQATQV